MKYAGRFLRGLALLALCLQLLSAACFAQGLTLLVDSAAADAAAQKITLTGSISSGTAQDLTVRVYRDGELLYINQFTCGEDGTFSFSFPADIETGQSLRLMVGGAGLDQPWEKTVTVAAGTSGGETPSGGGGGGAVQPSGFFAYITGDGQGLFHPDDGITRAEVSMIFARLGTGSPTFSGSQTASFADVAAGSWYYHCVGYAQAAALVNGYADGTFRPDAGITRAEFAKMAAAYAELSGGTQSGFSDVPATHWAAPAIAALAEKGWINGYEDGTFRPDEGITRAQAVKILNALLGEKPDEAALDAGLSGLKTFPDVSGSHWAYYHILLAANG